MGSISRHITLTVINNLGEGYTHADANTDKAIFRTSCVPTAYMTWASKIVRLKPMIVGIVSKHGLGIDVFCRHPPNNSE